MSGQPLEAAFEVGICREFHVGAGFGRGTDVDSGLFQDDWSPGQDKIHYNPAVRYVHGLLKQAVHDLIVGSDRLSAWRLCPRSGKVEGDKSEDGGGNEPGTGENRYCPAGQPACPVCRIFGTPAAPSRWTFSTMVPVRYAAGRPSEAAMEREPNVARRVVRRAGMDLVRRRPEDQRLFSEELGAPLVFRFTAACADDGDDAKAELALLAAAARTVPGLGRARRRGRGECRIDFEEGSGLDPEAFRQAFRTGWLDTEPASPPHTPAPAAARDDADIWLQPGSADAWIDLEILVRLDEPVIAGSRPLTGNLLGSHPFIPGSLLLGAFAGMALRAGADPSGSDFLRTFRGGGAVFPDLYPAFAPGGGTLYRAAMPTPLDLHTCPVRPGNGAADGHGHWSEHLLTANGEAMPRTCPDPACAGRHARLRRLRPLWAAGGDLGERNPLLRQEAKIEVDPVLGRVAAGSLYHREMLPTGTLVVGTLLVQPTTLEWLRRLGLIPGSEDDGWSGSLRLRLGKRNSRGYGGCRLVWRRVPDRTADRVRRVDAYHAAGWVPVVLTSRAIVKDSFGRSAQTLTPPLFGLPDRPAGMERAPCTVGWTATGGFWGHIGLPRQEDYALAPGSTLILRREDYGDSWDDLRDNLVALARASRPIGARLEDGFGRFAVAPLAYDDVTAAVAPDLSPDLRRTESIVPPPELAEDPPLRIVAGEFERELSEYRERIAATGSEAAIRQQRDRWRTIARMLHERAGIPAAALKGSIEQPAGGPALGLKVAANRARTKQPFLADQEGGALVWGRLVVLVDEAAGGEDVQARALRTRALAAALADLAAAEDA